MDPALGSSVVAASGSADAVGDAGGAGRTDAPAKKAVGRRKLKSKKKRRQKSAAAGGSATLTRAGGGYVLPAKPSTTITHSNVLELFDKDRDSHGTPYREQGDPTMYTEEALAKRRQLANHPGVVRTIDKFLALFTWTDHETVARGSYYDLHRRIVNVLLPHVTTVEALSLAKADWERDCEGNQELSKEQAYNAVFQLIDIWTASLDVAEYLALTNALYYRLTLGDAAASLIDKSAVIGGQASTARKLESADGTRPGTGHGASAADAGVGGGADGKK